jgi:hypothetical protein
VGFSAASRVAITVEKEYEMWAIVKWRRVWFFQIADDFDSPTWLPAWLFKVTNKSLGRHWQLYIGDGDVEVISGPSFIANSEDDYRAMVELHPDKVEAFWKNVRDRHPS